MHRPIAVADGPPPAPPGEYDALMLNHPLMMEEYVIMLLLPASEADLEMKYHHPLSQISPAAVVSYKAD